MTKSGSLLRNGLAEIGGGDACTWAAKLSWLIVLLDPIGHRLGDTPLTLLALAGLLSRRVCWHSASWTLATLLVAWPVLEDPYRVDNHAYLRIYWFLALAIAAWSRNPSELLVKNARGLIAGVFVFAVLWKGILSPDFVSGDFFRFTLLTDSRFTDFAAVVTGLTPDEQALNRERVYAALASPAGAWEKDFIEPPRLELVARVLTAWTLLVEVVIALAFVLPARFALSRMRDLPLIAFGITTYSVATVEGFGWLLCAIGLAQVDAGRPLVRLAYFACFAMILCYVRVPWVAWLAQLNWT